MKVGVSGASGHLGRAVVSELLERADGHKIVVISRTPDTPPRRTCGGAEISFRLKVEDCRRRAVARD